MKIIDCDIHQCWADPDEVFCRLPNAFRQPGYKISENLLPNPIGFLRQDAKPELGNPGSSPQLLIQQHVEPFGIEKLVLNSSGILTLGVHPNAYYASALARAYNDALCDTWLEADPRFYASLVVAPQDVEAAATEIRRLAGHPRIVQVLMCSATRVPLGQKCYWPIYQAASESGLPVAIHPGAEGKGIANSFVAGQPSTYLEWHANLSQNSMGQVVSLVTEGVFEKFPGLKFVCIEGGLGWIPHVMWRLDKNWKSLRSSVPWVKRLPSEYIIEHIRFTTQPVEEPAHAKHYLQILEMIQAEKTVMFSSDYPHWDGDSPLHALPSLPEEFAARIYHANAEELYNFLRTPPPQDNS